MKRASVVSTNNEKCNLHCLVSKKIKSSAPSGVSHAVASRYLDFRHKNAKANQNKNERKRTTKNWFKKKERKQTSEKQNRKKEGNQMKKGRTKGGTQSLLVVTSFLSLEHCMDHR